MFTSKKWKIQAAIISLLIILALTIALISSIVIDDDREGNSFKTPGSPVCEWPCSKEDKMTAGVRFATLDAESTMRAQSATLTVTPTASSLP